MPPKKTKKAFISWLVAKFTEYQDLMNLNNYQIFVHDKVHPDNDGMTVMQTRLNWDGYTNVNIQVHECCYQDWKSGDKARLEGVTVTILHELSHVLVMDIVRLGHKRFLNRDELLGHEERLCDNLAVILQKLIIDGK